MGVKENSLSGVNGAGTTGLEPATSSVTGMRSNQLIYAPFFLNRGARGGSRTHDLWLMSPSL